jgi:hypothetical protein
MNLAVQKDPVWVGAVYGASLAALLTGGPWFLVNSAMFIGMALLKNVWVIPPKALV